MCVQTQECAPICVLESTEARKGYQNPLNLELEVIVSYLIWVLETELQSSARIAKTRNH